MELSPDQLSYLQGIGFPSFDEFCKNPDKYRVRSDQVLATTDACDSILKRDIKKQYFMINGHKVETLEKVQQIANDLGWDLSKMKMEPELQKTTAGKYEVHMKFVMRGIITGEENSIEGK